MFSGGLFVILLSLILWFFIPAKTDTLPKAPLADKTLAVLRFENQTKDKNNDVIGFMAMDWISSALLETKDVKVIKVENLSLVDANKSYFKENGAEVFIKGRYYEMDDRHLLLTCDIVDAESEQIIYNLPPIQGRKDQSIVFLESVQQHILGYYELEGSYQGKRVPRYDAYKSYIEAISKPANAQRSEINKLLKKSIALDSLFLEPHYAIFVNNHWYQSETETKAAIAYLESHQDITWISL